MRRIASVAVFLILAMGPEQAYPQFQGADSSDLCCALCFFPFKRPLDKFNTWMAESKYERGERIITGRIGENIVSYKRASKVHFMKSYHAEPDCRIDYRNMVGITLLKDQDLLVHGKKVKFSRGPVVFYESNGAVCEGVLHEETSLTLIDRKSVV